MRNWLDIIRGKTKFEGNVVPQPYRRELLDAMPKGGVCAELGVKIGDFSKEIIDVTKPKEIRLVDVWRKPNTFHVFLGNILPYMKEETTDIKFLRANTGLAYSTNFLPDNYFDWIYVDADHSRYAVYSDLMIGMLIVKRGGFITGDDYDHKEYPGVVEAVQHFIKRFRVKPHAVGENRQFILEKL